MKPKKLIKRLLLGTAITIVVLLVAIRIAIPVAGVAIANNILPDILNTDASIGFINMILMRGRVSAGDIIIKQPNGFNDGTLFELGKASVNIDLPSLKNGPITIESITIDDLELNIIRDTNGIMNVESLADTSTTKSPTASNDVAEASSAEPPAIVVNTLEVRNLSFSYSDLTYTPPLTAQIEDLNLTITNIIFDPKQTDNKELPTGIKLTALLKQNELHDAFIGITAKLGLLGTNIPAVCAATRITGVELEHISSVIPPGISQALGGSCVDIYVDLAMASDTLDCNAQIKTADNTMRLAVGGTPSKPLVDKSTALGNVITRPGAIVGGLIGDTTGAGLKVITGAGETTAAIGVGASKVVAGIGMGLFHTAKGVATADLSEIKDGALETTVGTVKKTTDTITDTAHTAVDSVVDVASTATGISGTQAWRSTCEKRWNKEMGDAQKEINSAPYPQPKQ